MTEDSTASRAEPEQLMAELSSAHLVNLTGLGTAELVKALNGSAAAASAAIRDAGHNVAVAIDRIVPRLRNFGRLIYLSEAHHGQFRLLSQQDPELGFVTETISQTFSASDLLPATSAASAEEDQLAGAADMLALELTSQDCLIGISGAQDSPYLDAAMKSALRSGALTVRVCNSTAGISTGSSANEGEMLLSLPLAAAKADTRLPDFHLTVQQMIVNLMSAVCIARLGTATKIQTVDLRSTNETAFSRKQRTLMTATGLNAIDSAKMLIAADGSTKVAILMVMTGLPAERAHQILLREVDALENAAESQGR